MKDLIIDKPNLQSKRQRVLFGSMTLVFWILWIYLWLPILAMLGWALGLKIAYFQMVVQGGFAGLLHLLGFYATVIAFLGASLLLWAYYNFFRFRDVQRRRTFPVVPLAVLSRYYQVPRDVLEQWSQARCLVLHHDAAGKLLVDGRETNHVVR
jgi:biofilm PGA synthesis protein PgaD